MPLSHSIITIAVTRQGDSEHQGSFVVHASCQQTRAFRVFKFNASASQLHKGQKWREKDGFWKTLPFCRLSVLGLGTKKHT